jgi:SAM-dependent methyltransferase
MKSCGGCQASRLTPIVSLGQMPRVILEIGSNDGTLLRRFQRHTSNLLGIDPARNVASLAAAAGVETVVDFFSGDVAAELARARGGFDLILALNVVAHTPDFVGLFSRARDLLEPGGRFVVEVVHVLQTLEEVRLE